MSGRILFVDAFDSFTNNIIGLLEKYLQVEVTLVHINDVHVDQNLISILKTFDAVVVGPGPGHPANPLDVGFIDKLWNLDDVHMLPIFGICLGFQSLCLSQGAEIRKLQRARHGIVSKPTHSNTDIFAGISDLEATQYHSLCVNLDGRTKSDPDINNVFWEPPEAFPSLCPLAWDMTDNVNGPILMAVRHTTKPFWGVQFHPESICTSEEGKQLISNWWVHAKEWLSDHRRIREEGKDRHTVSSMSTSHGPFVPNITPQIQSTNGIPTSHLAQQLRSIVGEEDVVVRWKRYQVASITPTSLIDALGCRSDGVVLLDSQGHSSGRYSIIGLLSPDTTMKVTYKVSDRTLRYGIEQFSKTTLHLNSIDNVWPLLQEALDLHDPRNQESSSPSSTESDIFPEGMDQSVTSHLPLESPFWGGFMGYISYEAGLDTIDVEPHASCAESGIPDINFAFIHRSVVIDHAMGHVYVQSLLPHDWTWILKSGKTIEDLGSQPNLSQNGLAHVKEAEQRDIDALDKALSNTRVTRPEERTYRSKVLRCQESLASGDSYELCLTDETEVTIGASNGRTGLNPWMLYKRLRQNNPAPFGAFMHLSDVIVVSSSPERFLRWTRDGACQFRPIKGTVKKSSDMTRERACAILSSSKERAENLMIVDLIRHDLSGVIGADKTWVSKLMVIEEYETVYQLVSVIEGQLPDPDLDRDGPRGLDVLKSSLPPGSMTGAPKKRSCEILTEIEQRPRGVYSGVLGYMDIGGAGDFSVVIRTAVRYNDRCQEWEERNVSVDTDNRREAINTKTKRAFASPQYAEVWCIGAGGAVTIQSTDKGEFLEMEVKSSSVLGALFPQAK
jgi:para-aminobenzoate synthetase